MDDKRLGEIALLLVKRRLHTGGIKPDTFKRELGNEAKEIGITREELRTFMEALLPEILGEMLGRRSVALTTSD